MLNRSRMPAILTLLLCVSFAFLAQCSRDTESDAVREVFEQYKAAYSAGDGEAAAATLTESTFEYYDQIRHLVLYAEAKLVWSQPASVLGVLLQVRLEGDLDRVEEMDGKEFFVYCFEQDWATGLDVEEAPLDKIEVDGATAMESEPAEAMGHQLGWLFSRTNGQWHIDVPAIDRSYDAFMQDMARQARMSLPELFIETMDLPEDIWQKPRRVR